jgi:integrase
MTTAELQSLSKKCLASLHELVGAAGMGGMGPDQPMLDRWFAALLVTAILCLGLAPRSQVLAQLRIGSSFVKHEEGGRYWVKLLADMNKNARPTTFPLVQELTPALDLYLQTVRPRLLRTVGDAAHDYVFFKRNGSAPRSDFKSCTTLVTQQMLGRAVNPHAFRSAVITLYVDTGATQSELDNLACIMAHSADTAKAYYYRPAAHQKAIAANDRMRDLLLQ